MTLVVLIRHAHSSANAAGILSGQRPDVHLSPQGLAQAKGLIKRLGNIKVHTIHTSPMVRCQETISPWATKFGSRMFFDEGINEVNYGLWTGKKLRTLSKDPLWKLVQEKPSKVIFPEGESMKGMQKRAVKTLLESASESGKNPAMLVSHGDVIKAMIAYALGMHLDQFQKIVVDPASITILDVSKTGTKVLLMNNSTATISEILNSQPHKRLLVGGGSGSSSGRGKK